MVLNYYRWKFTVRERRLHDYSKIEYSQYDIKHHLHDQGKLNRDSVLENTVCFSLCKTKANCRHKVNLWIISFPLKKRKFTVRERHLHDYSKI